MNTAKSRLATLSNKTVKGAVRRICESLIDMADSIPDQNLSQIAIDKLSAYNSDIAVKSFVSNESRLLTLLDMGIKKSVDRILSESSIVKYPHLKGPISQFRKLSEVNPDYLIIENYLNTLKPLLWEPIVKNEYGVLESLKNNLSEDIVVKTSIDIIKSSRNSFIYGPLLEKLEAYVMDRTTGSRKMIIQELDRYKFDTNINKLANNLRLLENSFGAFNIISNSAKCSVKNSIGFVDIKESFDYVLLDGSFYKKKGASISPVNEAEIKKNSPSLWYLNAISKSRNFSIQGDSVVMLMGKDTIKINENGSIDLNGTQLTRDELTHKAAVSSIIDPSYSRGLNDVLAVHENISKLMEIDFAKTISSNLYEGLKINVIKGDKYVVNFVNPAMNENRIINFTKATQLKNFVWDTLSYDISESFVETLSEENRRVNQLKNTANKLFGKIVMVEGEIEKIEKEKEKDEDIKESKMIMRLQESLVEELRDLKSRYKVVSRKLNEASHGVPLPSVGDTVKVRSKGTGTVLSVDGVDKRFIVLLNNGETVQCIDKDLDVVETMIKRSATASPEANIQMIQGSNAKPLGKHYDVKKAMSLNLKENEDFEEEEITTIPMDDVKGMTTNPSSVVRHSEFGETYEMDMDSFSEMSAKGEEDYYPEMDEEEDTDLENEKHDEELEEGRHGHDFEDWDEMDQDDDYGYDDEEDFDDDDFEMEVGEYDDDEEDFDGGFGSEYTNRGGFGEIEEDVESSSLEMEEEAEESLRDYERESAKNPGYGSRQAMITDPDDEYDMDEYPEEEDDLEIQFEEEDNDEDEEDMMGEEEDNEEDEEDMMGEEEENDEDEEEMIGEEEEEDDDELIGSYGGSVKED